MCLLGRPIRVRRQQPTTSPIFPFDFHQSEAPIFVRGDRRLLGPPQLRWLGKGRERLPRGALSCSRSEMKGASFHHLVPNYFPLTLLEWKHVEVEKERAGEEWTDILGWYQGVTKISEDGWGVFRCHGQSVGIWIKLGARGRD